ncbi:MAG: type II toxin-antitoxin system HicB family antitoxin [Planctomycetes bacterium]|nr:type II toxin-antitoxin system HicB family antitoxin [Planctomycetota bacterium]
MSKAQPRTYRVEFETDRESGMIVVSIPTLNFTGDFGPTVEEALRRLRKLAAGYIETLLEEREPVPASDALGSGIFITLALPRKTALSR